MILQGRFNSVFTPQSMQALSTSKSLYLYPDDSDGGGGERGGGGFPGGGGYDPFPSAKTVSIEHHCDKDYVG